MTLYYSLVFVILVAEMVSFLFLVAPLPGAVRRNFVNILHKNPLVAQISLALKFTFVFILVLFVDSVNRVWRVQEEMSQARSRPGNVAFSDRDDYLARKFYAQRNMYLCGFTLFLSLILNRTYQLVKQVIQAPAASSTGSQTEFEKKLKQKDLEIETLKKQSEGLSREYNRLADESNAKAGVAAVPVDKKNQ